MKLLNVGQNVKTLKGDRLGEYLTGILYLAPADISGYQVCAWSTKGCRDACLYSAGRGRFSNVQQARIAKTKMFFEEREKFWGLLCKDIEALIKKCNKLGLKPAVRLNGTSDLLWENLRFEKGGQRACIFEHYPTVQFYDYTKAPSSARKNFENYSLTYSRSSDVQKPQLLRALREGANVAVVFSGELPTHYWGYEVINGDLSDLRFLDPSGVIVGLSAKGIAKKAESEFIVAA